MEMNPLKAERYISNHKISYGFMQNNWRRLKNPYLLDDHKMYTKKLGRSRPTGFLLSGPN